MFKKLSVAQLLVLSVAVNDHKTRLSNAIADGNTHNDIKDTAVRAEQMVRLGNDFATTVALSTAINTNLATKNDALVAKAAKKSAKTEKSA